MSDIDVDVNNLFKKIGGVEPTYQEIRRQSRTDQARERWPLLHSLQVEEEGAAGELHLAFPPAKSKPVAEVRHAKKSGLEKLFKTLESGKAPSGNGKHPPDAGVLVHLTPKPVEKDPFAALFASREAAAEVPPPPGLFQKTAKAEEREAPSFGLFRKEPKVEESTASGLFRKSGKAEEREAPAPGLFQKRSGAEESSSPSLFNKRPKAEVQEPPGFGLFQKRSGAEAQPGSSLFGGMFKTPETPSNSLQSMFEKLKKS